MAANLKYKCSCLHGTGDALQLMAPTLLQQHATQSDASHRRSIAQAVISVVGAVALPQPAAEGCDPEQPQLQAIIGPQLLLALPGLISAQLVEDAAAAQHPEPVQRADAAGSCVFELMESFPGLLAAVIAALGWVSCTADNQVRHLQSPWDSGRINANKICWELSVSSGLDATASAIMQQSSAALQGMALLAASPDAFAVL